MNLTPALACGLLALAASAARPALGAPAADRLSPDALIARHVEARGGAAALRAIRTLEMTGTLRLPGFATDLQYRELIARPDSIRIEATLQGMTPIQAYDGARGWQIQPFQGRKDPEALSADDVKSLAEEADFEDALMDYRAKGSTLDDLGEVDVDGGPTFALRVTLKNGDQETYYLDPDTFLTVRVVTRQILHGAESLSQTDYGDYERVDGVYFPFEVDSGPKGASERQRVTYTRIRANVPLAPALFAEPGAPPGVRQVVTPLQPEDQTPPGDRRPGVPPPPSHGVKAPGPPPQSEGA